MKRTRSRARLGASRSKGIRPQFDAQVTAAYRRLERLAATADDASGRPALLRKALEELSIALRELQVASEEIHRQNLAIGGERDRAEAAHRRYLDLFESAPDAYFVTTPDGVIRDANRGAGKLVAVGARHLRGKPISIFFSSETKRGFFKLLEALTRGNGLRDLECLLRPRRGEELPIVVNATSLRDPSGRITGLLWMIHDVSTMKQAADALRDAKRKTDEDCVRLAALEGDLRRLSGRLLETQDEERRRISRNLHDSMGQKLVAAGLLLDAIERGSRLDATAKEHLSRGQSLLGECVQEVRMLSSILHPPVLEDLGLRDAIRWYAARFSEESGVSVDLTLGRFDRRLPTQVERALFRCIQECLTNVHRHSGAKSCRVVLSFSKRGIRLEVIDHGRGLRGKRGPAAGRIEGLGVGILGMRERIRQLAGRLDVRFGPHGTTVQAWLPPMAGQGAEMAPAYLAPRVRTRGLLRGRSTDGGPGPSTRREPESAGLRDGGAS